MIYDITHVTSVKYDAIVRLARFNLRLQPALWPGQTLMAFNLGVAPNPLNVVDSYGPFVVNVARLTIMEPLVELTITSQLRVDVNPPALMFKALAPQIGEIQQQALAICDVSNTSPSAYLFDARLTTAEETIAHWAQPMLHPGRNILDAALELAQAIRRDFRYDPKATQSDTPAAVAFAQRSGVCQDFAHIMIIALRSQGLAAGYVSGYLRTLPPPGKPRLVGADATHAWVNIWCGPHLGWVGFDPTNGCMTGADHIFTAMGRDYADVAPVDGVFFGGSGQHMKVSVDVVPRDPG